MPIPPQSLTITSPFAISGDVTLNGYIEEHAGIPTRIISLAGTMGVMPGRDSVGSTGGSGNLFGATGLFAGTLQNATTTAKFATALVGVGSQPPNLYTQSDLTASSTDPTAQVKTGYVNMRLLEILLEYYAYLKSTGTPASKKLRLGFSMYKDNYIYLCTPMRFNRKKMANKPLEEQYEITLKAWKRINPTQSPGIASVAIAKQYTSSVLGQIATKLQQARSVLQSAKQTIEAVRTDVDSAVFEPLRTISLMVNDAANIEQSLDNLPTSILSDLQSDVILSWKQIGVNINPSTGISLNLNQINQEFSTVNLQTLGQYASTLGAGPVSSTTNTAVNSPFYAPNSTGNYVSSIVAGGGVYPSGQFIKSFNVGPIHKYFTNPDYYAQLWSQIKVNDINLSQSSSNAINTSITNARKLSKNYVQKIIDNIQLAADTYADSVGQGNATYNAVYNRTPGKQIRVATSQDFSILASFQSTVSTLQQFIATQSFNPSNPTPSSLNYIASLASASGITFQLPQSKFLVPVPYGTTLERLAAIYLGDPNRWIEIATLNQLKEPYIDEEGFNFQFVSSPSGAQVVIPQTDQIAINQTVWCTGPNLNDFKTTVLALQTTLDGNMVITLNILQNFNTPFNLTGYTTLFAFAPGTTNSQQLIFIPSDEPSNNLDNEYSGIPGVNNLDNLLAIGGIDLLLQPDMDLVVTNSGDCLYAFGLQNIVQTIQIVFATEKGSLLHHPEFGFPASVGQSVADLQLTRMIASLQGIFNNDPTFSGVKGISAQRNRKCIIVDGFFGPDRSG